MPVPTISVLTVPNSLSSLTITKRSGGQSGDLPLGFIEGECVPIKD